VRKDIPFVVLRKASPGVRRLNQHLVTEPHSVPASADGAAQRSTVNKSTVVLPSADVPPDISIEAKSTDEENLNKLERAWLAELRGRGVRNIGIQNITLKIADHCRYTPDFTGIDADNRRCAWETKGFFRDDAKVKLKVAARQFRHLLTFYLVTRKKREWLVEIVNP
jgi:hypothetical protein